MPSLIQNDKIRDFQRQKVYDWEYDYNVNSMPKGVVCQQSATAIVNHIWSSLGLMAPPEVIITNEYLKSSTGDRFKIKLSNGMNTQHILIHELAHSFNRCSHREVYDHHGPNWVADYAFLLVRFYNKEPYSLLYTTDKVKVKINNQLLFQNMSEFK